MRRRPPLLAPPLLALACALAALALPSCRRTTEGQTAILLTLGTQGPVDCVVLVETAATGSAREELDKAHGLPPGFTGKDWKTARLTALIYSGNQLGEGALTLTAEGHRGSCTGPVVSKLGALDSAFKQGEVVKLEGVLALLGVDADHDGWATPEDCDDHDPTIYPGAPELCDGKDHSCSGVIDAGCACTGGPRACYPLGLSDPTLGVGLCVAGRQSCTGGKWEAECVGAVLPAPERCDQLDHDCDGQKGLPSCPCKPGDTRRCFTKGPTRLAGVGRCAWGNQACAGDGFFGACEGDVGPLPLEICNGLDDNCDGTVDEMADAAGKPIMVRPACSKVDGVCAGSLKRCVNGAFASCTNADYLAAALANGSAYGQDVDFCDGADHDCDGVSDTGCGACPSLNATRDCYGPGLSSPTLQHAPCKKGTETCLRNNNQLRWGTCQGQVEPAVEVCDGVDNNCNGTVDDLPKNEGAPCDTGRPGVCGPGARGCVAGALLCQSITGPNAEVCNGLDDDCDGRIDQGFDKLHDPAHCGGANDCRACASGDACCLGRCADLKVDSLNCGVCGTACGQTQGCCAGTCVALDTATSCGACGLACAPGETCRNGLCATAHETRCDNGLDDDGDGLIDCQDPDCADKPCDSTGSTCRNGACVKETNCQNGLDDDGNGLTDCQDPNCLGKACANNGVCTAGKQCIREICANGIDDNGDGKIDCQDLAACPPPLGGPGAQYACCGVAWSDLKSDVAHCGGCGIDCRPGHDFQCGSIACVQGVCKYGPAPDRQACSGGICCRGGCVPDHETSCTNGVDDNCDGKIDCDDPVACPAPGGLTAPACCGHAWTDTDHGDPLNCGSCGHGCASTGLCKAATCEAGGQCGMRTTCEKATCDQQSCVSGGTSGTCANGTCCTGCVNSANQICQAGTDLHACKDPASLFCTDCAPGNNPCITDACGPTGCTHTNNSNACTDAAGNTGTCNQGACCAGCIDAGGACQPIDAAHCGKPGQACIPSCVDGNACTQDVCNNAGAIAFCTNPGLLDGTACADGSATGQCRLGSCCLGCVDASGQCLQPGSENPGACGLGGGACAPCPAPLQCQEAATCTLGACGATNKADGTICGGGTGTCSAGLCNVCASLCGGNGGGGVCCDPGETCTNNECVCDQTTCAKAGGCCTTQSPAQCVKASPTSCSTVCSSNAGNPLEYCKTANSDAGGCVQGCFATCGLAGVTCGGTQCLVPLTKGTDNVCSDGVHPESCDVRLLAASDWCSCDATDRPGTCPLAFKVCKADAILGAFHCVSCGDNGTNGLACKGGGLCVQSSGKCQ